jgi:predicted GH43/DUF377 family glycosyl hydrolase
LSVIFPIRIVKNTIFVEKTMFFFTFRHLCFSLFILLLKTILTAVPIDLEDKIQEFVLETRRIRVPEFPHAYNPSVVRWQGRLLLSFNQIDPVSYNMQIGLVWLDDHFNTVSPPQLLDTHGLHSEDARLVTAGDKLYITFSDNRNPILSAEGFRVYLGELRLHGDQVFIHEIECLAKFEGESKLRREKNWVAFDYQKELLLAYTINPHLIFSPLRGKGECKTIAKTFCLCDWPWGEIRGGTPALRIGDEYLSFFHSSKKMTTINSNGKKVLHYFMGAYTFNAEPPFELTRISPEPIIGKNFYHGKTYRYYWNPLRVVFPCGLLAEGEHLWVSYGRQDHEMWVAKIHKEGLLRSLIPVSKSL